MLGYIFPKVFLYTSSFDLLYTQSNSIIVKLLDKKTMKQVIIKISGMSGY